jgi:glycosyltransferase involved in cell wall biosynthesis
MRYVFVDDSPLAYDGYTPLRRAVGGQEKAVVGLAAALQERGHDVKVINNVSYAHMAEGAYYVPFGDSQAPRSTDVLIGLRKPAMLGFLRAATHRLLWVMGDPTYLKASANEPLWDSFGASLLFVGENQKRAYGGKVRNLVLGAGVRSTYFEPEPTSDIAADVYGIPYSVEEEEARLKARAEAEAAAAAAEPKIEIPPPHAVVTTHPLQGLPWLVDIWTKQIHPQVPAARLSVYSAVLSKGLRGGEVPANIAPILEQVKAAAEANVVVVDPLPDSGMNDVYRKSRVHLYPGDAQDFACWTLAESQTAGLPAVARPLGGADERIDNGESGYLVPDAAAFANVAVQILTNDDVYRNLSTAAGDVRRRKVWATAAEKLDAFIASLPVDQA